ncbi:MAG TPA: VOC family protein [Streptosporangiaceae bacterium]|nr:VOC family protein [Streptosporangiaceae bacterium]
MAHAVVHFEIGGPDDLRLAEFYSGLFGWRVRPVPDADYALIDTSGGAGIGGGIEPTGEGEQSVTFYIQADDLQAVLDKVNLLGGKTVTPITELVGMATYAKFEDPDGLVVGLVLGSADPGTGDRGRAGQVPGQAGSADPPAVAVAPSAGSGAPVDWFELSGADPDSAQRFYAEIFGWRVTQAAEGYRMIDTGSARGIAGGIAAGLPGSWATAYARVPDVAAALEAAAALGGRREYGPQAVGAGMHAGALRDPAGNVFGVYSRLG